MYINSASFLEVFQVWTPNMAQNAETMKIGRKLNFLMWIFQKWSVLPHYSHLFPKILMLDYQLNEYSGCISGLDSEHGIQMQMSEV